MRLWSYRVSLRPVVWIPGARSEDYMEWAFPTRRQAHGFAHDLLDDPSITRVECVDSAGRVDPLILRAA